MVSLACGWHYFSQKINFPTIALRNQGYPFKNFKGKKKSTIIGAVINTKGNVNYVPEEIWQLENLRINIPKL